MPFLLRYYGKKKYLYKFRLTKTDSSWVGFYLHFRKIAVQKWHWLEIFILYNWVRDNQEVPLHIIMFQLTEKDWGEPMLKQGRSWVRFLSGTHCRFFLCPTLVSKWSVHSSHFTRYWANSPSLFIYNCTSTQGSSLNTRWLQQYEESCFKKVLMFL